MSHAIIILTFRYVSEDVCRYYCTIPLIELKTPFTETNVIKYRMKLIQRPRPLRQCRSYFCLLAYPFHIPNIHLYHELSWIHRLLFYYIRHSSFCFYYPPSSLISITISDHGKLVQPSIVHRNLQCNLVSWLWYY